MDEFVNNADNGHVDFSANFTARKFYHKDSCVYFINLRPTDEDSLCWDSSMIIIVYEIDSRHVIK